MADPVRARISPAHHRRDARKGEAVTIAEMTAVLIRGLDRLIGELRREHHE